MSFVKALISSRQAQVASIGYLILFVCVLVAMFTKNRDVTSNEEYSSGGEMFLTLLLVIIGYILSIFSINCMVEGQVGISGCGIWAWVNSVIVIFFAAAIVLTVLFWS